ncbi:MAG: hypothetical protein ACOCRK_07700 [bacterium]
MDFERWLDESLEYEREFELLNNDDIKKHLNKYVKFSTRLKLWFRKYFK